MSIIVATLTTFVFGRNDPTTMNPKLFPPFLRRFIKTKEYHSVYDKEDEEDTLDMVYDVKIKSDLNKSLKDDVVL